MNKMDKTTADILAEMQRYGITRFGELPPARLVSLTWATTCLSCGGKGRRLAFRCSRHAAQRHCLRGRPRVLSPSGSMASKRWIKQPGTLAEAEAAGDPLRGAAAVGQGATAVLPMIGPGVARTERGAGWYRQTRQPKARAKPPAH